MDGQIEHTVSRDACIITRVISDLISLKTPLRTAVDKTSWMLIRVLSRANIREELSSAHC